MSAEPKLSRDDRLLIATIATAITPMISASSGALFAYGQGEPVLRWGATGLGVGLLLMFVVGIATWNVTE